MSLTCPACHFTCPTCHWTCPTCHLWMTPVSIVALGWNETFSLAPNRDPKHNVGQASYRNRNTTWDRFQTGIETRKTTWDRGLWGIGASNGNPTGNVDQPTPPADFAAYRNRDPTWGIKTGEKGQESYKKSPRNVPWGSERQGGDKKEGDKSHIKRVVGKEKVETKQQKDGVVFVVNERVFNSNERVSNEMIFNSN
ncbi:hypothetical protein TNCV_2584491 [Trichonephila clavipes]|nr:hypothetical protein TNCV_2584491 [Trichonephila clavipes]